MSLKNILLEYDILITYNPLSDEINFKSLDLFDLQKMKVFLINSDKNLDPFKIALELIISNKNKKVCILVPGQKFDTFGNRKGRGGGWYDRFLSAIPKDWLRIGIADANKILNSKLDINSWDQTVDWIISVSREIKFIETFARK
jgi:5-formyltetrahydrofolate cyclo-ligase